MFVGLMHDLQTTFAERWLKLQIEIGPLQGGPGPQRPPSRGVTGPAGGLPGASRRQALMVASKPAADGLVTSGEPPPPSVQRGSAGVAEPAFVANPYAGVGRNEDRKSTRLNSSHDQISYAVFCLKKKKNKTNSTKKKRKKKKKQKKEK